MDAGEWILVLILLWPFIILPLVRAIHAADQPGNSDERLGRGVKGFGMGLLAALVSFVYLVWPGILLGGVALLLLFDWIFFRDGTPPMAFTMTLSIGYFIVVNVIAFSVKSSRQAILTFLD